MHSLILGLPLFAVFHGLYDIANLKNKTTDPGFYLGLFCGALIIGYVLGRLSRLPLAKSFQQKLGFSDPKTSWADVMGQPEAYVIVHLNDKTVLYGYPNVFTDDPREEVRELYLIDAHVLTDDGSGGEAFARFEGTEGILVESSQIKLIQLVTKPEADQEEVEVA